MQIMTKHEIDRNEPPDHRMLTPKDIIKENPHIGHRKITEMMQNGWVRWSKNKPLLDKPRKNPESKYNGQWCSRVIFMNDFKHHMLDLMEGLEPRVRNYVAPSKLRTRRATKVGI